MNRTPLIYNIDGDRRPYPEASLLNDRVRRYYLQDGKYVQHIRHIRRVYGVFESVGGKRFIYHPTPKNGTTSIKFLLARMASLESAYRDYDDIPIHQQRRLGCEHIQFKNEGMHRTAIVGFPHLPIHDYIASVKFTPSKECDIRFCVVRDPVDRFISLYKNRIVFHREIAYLEFNEFLDRLGEFQKHNSDFNTQHYFLGEDPSYYTDIFSFRNMHHVAELLGDIVGTKLSIPHLQKAPHIATLRPTKKQRRMIEKIFAKDYEIFGNYL